jgi:hypothetical protein
LLTLIPVATNPAGIEAGKPDRLAFWSAASGELLAAPD